MSSCKIGVDMIAVALAIATLGLAFGALMLVSMRRPSRQESIDVGTVSESWFASHRGLRTDGMST